MNTPHIATSMVHGVARAALPCVRPATLTLSTLALCTSLAAYAQTPAPQMPGFGIGDALKEVQPPRPPAPRQAPVPEIIEQDTRPLALPDGETLTVREFRFEGVESIAVEDLQAAVAPFVGRALTMAEIEQAAARITALCRQRGYPVARAYVPRQDARNGVLTIRVLVGQYGRFSLKNGSRVSDALVEEAFSPLRNEPVISRAGLERAMLLVSDLPGAQLPRLVVSPGEAAGTSDIEIQVEPGKRFGGYALVDNHGSLYTGKHRLQAGADWNSPLGIGDRLSVAVSHSQSAGLTNGRLSYSLPLPAANGLRAELAAAKTRYELGDAYADLEATGTAHTLEGTLSYPVIRGRGQNLYVSLNLAAKRMRDEIDVLDMSIPKKAKVATLAVQHQAWGSLFDLPGYASVTGSVTWGHLDITDAEQKAFNAQGADTTGKYGRFNLSLNGNLSLAADWTVGATLNLQQALRNKNLDSSEQLTISGPNGVKAYRETVSGDNGYLLNAELRYLLPSLPALNHSVGVFADTGRIHLQNPEYAAENGVRLSDIGLGYYASYQGLIAGVQFARTVGPRPDAAARDGKTRVLVQVGMVF